MSNYVYPTLPGLDFGVQRDVMPPPVSIKTTPSLREYRARSSSSVRYKYSLQYEFLRSASQYAELQQLVGFYNLVGGPLNNFLFSDPDDSSVTSQVFGAGDGSTKAFQLTRSYGGFLEPVIATDGMIQVYYNGSPTNMLANGAAFDNVTSWVQAGTLTVTANSTQDPSGVTDADTVADTDSTNASCVAQTISIVDDTNYYTASVCVAKTSGGTSKTVLLRIITAGGTGQDIRIYLDTDTGAILSSTAGTTTSVTSLGSSVQYWRVGITWQANNTGNTTLQYLLYPAASANGTASIDGTQTGSAVFYGAMLTATSTVSGFTSRQHTWNPTTGIVTFSIAPSAGIPVSWSGSFFWRCRFDDPKMTVSKFMNNLFENRKVSFQTVIGEYA